MYFKLIGPLILNVMCRLTMNFEVVNRNIHLQKGSINDLMNNRFSGFVSTP